MIKLIIIYECRKGKNNYLLIVFKKIFFTNTNFFIFKQLIKETISTRWHGIRFFEHVLLVISIPAEFDDRAKDTMRKCLYNAGLTNRKDSTRVEFTTERRLKINLTFSLMQLFYLIYFFVIKQLKLLQFIACETLQNKMINQSQLMVNIYFYNLT